MKKEQSAASYGVKRPFDPVINNYLEETDYEAAD